MKMLSQPRLDFNRMIAAVSIILLGMIAFLFLRMMIELFCDCLARPMFLGL